MKRTDLEGEEVEIKTKQQSGNVETESVVVQETDAHVVVFSCNKRKIGEPTKYKR